MLDSLRPWLDLGLGGVALLLYYKQGEFLKRLAISHETHEVRDQERHAAMDARLDLLEERRAASAAPLKKRSKR